MDAHQDRLRNPLGFDEACTNCPALATARERIVHGYGDVGADFLVVGESPGEGPERTGVPFTGDERGRALQSILRELGLVASAPDADEPDVTNVYLTYLTRCRHPDRPPTDDEVAACDPFLTAELRMINPEVVVPVGTRALRAIALEVTTADPETLDAERDHATTIRGRGFELVPAAPPESLDADRREVLRCTLCDVLSRDYRQTKGRRGRRERAERSARGDDE